MKLEQIIQEVRDFSLELCKIGITSLIVNAPLAGLLYSSSSLRQQEILYEQNQSKAAYLADINKDGHLSSNELPYFITYGGKIFIR